MELAKSGRGAVQRELERLRKGGWGTVHKVATQKHYQANAASPLFDELCGIIQKTAGLAGPISLTLYTEVDFQERLDNGNPFISRILIQANQ